MTKKETTRRLIITNVLFWLGLLVCFGAMGHLDYLAEQRITYGIKELWVALGKGIGGLTLMLIGAFVGRNLEFDNEEADVDGDE